MLEIVQLFIPTHDWMSVFMLPNDGGISLRLLDGKQTKNIKNGWEGGSENRLFEKGGEGFFEAPFSIFDFSFYELSLCQMLGFHCRK